jgi:transcriptional regulator with XRE-family HTH domain
MDNKERVYKHLKLGLTIRKIIDLNQQGELKRNKANNHPSSLVTSIRQLEAATGIPNSSLVRIINGQKNPSWSTVDTIINGLELTAAAFGKVYDAISEIEVMNYQKELLQKQKERAKNRTSG